MPSVVDVVCTAAEFRGIKCPYTGEALEVHMIVRPGCRPLFHAPAAYAPSDPCESSEMAYRRWSREGGIEGVRTGRQIRCAYTGALLSPARDSRGFYYSGGFDPKRFLPREEFLAAFGRGDGASCRAEAVPPAPDAPPRKFDTDLSAEALRIAEGVVDKHRADLPPQARIAVSMSVGKRGRRA